MATVNTVVVIQLAAISVPVMKDTLSTVLMEDHVVVYTTQLVARVLNKGFSNRY